MAFGSFFKTPSHKAFNYRPRYFDPEMEDLRNRVKSAEREVKGPEAGPYVPNIRGKMKNHLITQKVATGKKQGLLRLIIITVSAILIMMILYFLIEFTGYLY